jgi:hypothetical protein
MSARALSVALLVAGAAWSGMLLAQEATPSPTPGTAEKPFEDEDLDVSRIDQILKGDSEVLQGDMFTYDPAGRRDPFQSLLNTRPGEKEPEVARPPGLAGMLIEEVRVQGIVSTSSGILAFVQGRDKLSYIIRPGTKLFNGEVESITPNEVVFKQQVSDPKQLKPYEEVVRKLSD